MPVLWACLFVCTFQLLSADSSWNLYHKQDEGNKRKTSTFSGSRIICKTWTTANRTQSIKLTINMLIRGRGWEWPELTFDFELCVCPQIFVNMITKPACIIDNSCMIWLHFEKPSCIVLHTIEGTLIWNWCQNSFTLEATKNKMIPNNLAWKTNEFTVYL